MRAANRLAALSFATAALLLAGCETTTEINGQPAVTQAPQSAPTEAELRKRAVLRLQLAATYYQKGQLPVAVEEAQRALTLDPGYADAYGLLGLINMDLGKAGEADSNFQRALQIEPDNGEILNNYGWFLCQSGRERQSIEFFRRAAASKSYRTPAMSMQNAGICTLRLKDPKTAEDFFKRAFELDASSPVAKFQLAQLYLGAKQLERARFYYGLLPKPPEAGSDVIWLGLRIARAEGDVRTEQQLAAELARRYPDSREASALRRGAFDE